MAGSSAQHIRMRDDTIRRLDRFAALFGNVSRSLAIDLALRALEVLHEKGVVGKHIPLGILFPHDDEPRRRVK